LKVLKNEKFLVYVLVFLILIFTGILPVFLMVIKSFWAENGFSFSYYQEIFSSGRAWVLLKNSFVLSSLVAFFCTVIGVPLGILFGKTNLPFRRTFAVLFSIPLLIPPYIVAISWFHIFGKNGFLSKIFGSSIGEVSSSFFFGLGGSSLVLFSVFLPVVIILTIAYLRTVNPRLEEAGRLVAKWKLVLKEISLPLIFSGIFLATMLVFILSFGELGVPLFLRYNVFPVESFTQFSAFYNFGSATASAVPLTLVAFGFLLIERFFLREKTYQLKVSDDEFLIIKLPHKKLILLFVGLFCFFLVVLPFSVLFFKSLSFDVYKQAIEVSGDSILRSFIYASIGATFLAVIGFFVGYFVYNNSFRFSKTLDSLTIFLFALPSSVIGIGLISFYNNALTEFIYTTPLIIIIGYLAKYIAISNRITVASLSQIPPSMEEAGQIVGAKWFRRVFWIVIPLIKKGLIVSWIVSFIFCLRDFGITMMVYPPGHDTFSIRIFTLMANGSPELISALCVIMILSTVFPLFLGWFLLERFSK